MKYDDVLESSVFGHDERFAGDAVPMTAINAQAKVRHLVANWADDAPRGAVSAFCAEHQVSRSWFYKVRAAAVSQGPQKAMERASTRPMNSPRKTSHTMERLLLEARATLKKEGTDHGPLSVMAKLERQGIKPPSRATVCRIFARAGVVSAGTTKPRETASVEPLEEQNSRTAMSVPEGEWRAPTLRIVRPNDTQETLWQENRAELAKPMLRVIEAATRKVDNNGTVTVLGTHFQVGKNRVGQNVTVLRNETTIVFFDHRGTEIINHPIPSKGTRYVGKPNPARFYG